MKKILRTVGYILAVFGGACLLVVVLNARSTLTDARHTSGQNIAMLAALIAIFAGLFFIGRRLTRVGKRGAKPTSAHAAEKPVPAPVKVPEPTSSAGKSPETPLREAEPSVPEQPPRPASAPEESFRPEELDDITFIRATRSLMCGPWHQYDVLLAARGYGWDMAVDWAAYMAGADLRHIGTVSVSDPGGGETELIASCHAHGDDLRSMPELRQERGMLGLGGESAVLGDMVKIVWINQTNALRLFTLQDQEAKLHAYVETMVRRTFGTPDAMKVGKPIPEEEKKA